MRILDLPYIIAKHLFICEGTCTYAAPIAPLAIRKTRGMVVRLDAEQLLTFIAKGQAPWCEELAQRMEDPKLHCFGAIRDDDLLAFCWFCEEHAESVMNRGYHPVTDTRINLTHDAAFMFHGYTNPEARRQGWQKEILFTAAAKLQAERGIAWIVTTTEIVNYRVKNGLTSLGFEHRGNYWQYGIGSWIVERYPQATLPVVGYFGNRQQRYV